MQKFADAVLRLYLLCINHASWCAFPRLLASWLDFTFLDISFCASATVSHLGRSARPAQGGGGVQGQPTHIGGVRRDDVVGAHMALFRGATHRRGGAVRRSFRAAGCVRPVFRRRSARRARMRGLSGLRPARMLGVRVREGGRTLRAAQHRCVTHERVVGSWGRAVGQGRVGSGVAWSVGHAALVCKNRRKR